VVLVLVGRRKRVDARMLSLCHTLSLFIHSFMVILFLIIVKRREEKRRGEEKRREERELHL
jgi:hypothetical protein